MGFKEYFSALMSRNAIQPRYRDIQPRYSDIQVWANSTDPDQTSQNVIYDQVLYCLSLILQF